MTVKYCLSFRIYCDCVCVYHAHSEYIASEVWMFTFKMLAYSPCYSCKTQHRDQDKKKVVKSPIRSKATRHSAGGGHSDTGSEAVTGKSSHFWRDWHTIKPRAFGLKKRNSAAIEQKPLLLDKDSNKH